MSSWWGGGASKGEIDALKDEVSRLQREREQLQVKCSSFEQQLLGMAQRRAEKPQGASKDQSSPLSAELKAFVDTAEIAIFGIDVRGNVIAWNSRVEELMGKRSQTVLGRTLAEVLSESHETPVETRTEVDFCLVPPHGTVDVCLVIRHAMLL